MSLREMMEAINNFGVLLVIAGIFLFIIICIASVALKEYIKDRDIKRAERKEDREQRRIDRQEERQAQREQNAYALNISKKLSEIIENNSDSIEDFRKLLDLHENKSFKNFEEMKTSLIDVDKKVDNIQTNTKDLATKKGLEEVKKTIDELKNKMGK